MIRKQQLIGQGIFDQIFNLKNKSKIPIRLFYFLLIEEQSNYYSILILKPNTGITIIHIHGRFYIPILIESLILYQKGGNQFNVPIFLINYSKASKYPFELLFANYNCFGLLNYKYKLQINGLILNYPDVDI
ncbi:unnamed protein product [Paramecium octaurelia]|uniref:Uncharacterized protein n=1 Tax=Paramecium octaurelia TaxID=43137 RepID=A0A8S1SH45_PAROT|nr:unnamed protein product [Paramecium octaurelia]